MIEFKAITKQYADDTALQAVNLRVNSRELFVLVGPSGSGKTTLLKTVNRLVVPTSGQVLIDGESVADQDLQQLRRHVGYVLQSSALFPNMTVMQNAAVQLEALGWDKAQIKPRIEHLLQLVDLDPKLYAQRKPAQLSGGEAQRVGIVRALAADPKLMLMDEPFSALDPVAKRQLQNLILRLHQKLATTIIFVTHDMQEALRLADRMAVLHNGRLQQVGTPQAVLAAPANAFVADFFKDVIAAQQTLAQVVAAGFGRPAHHAADKTLFSSTSIYTWAALLHAAPESVVQVGATQLTAADLIAYLATCPKGGLSHV
ncbi:ABC transporter ATP-binding protein [Lacticaseibacillus baoqingensis]|uniref:ABC transporter ATP-binding protein n=1 Tax=Lacticaseibacillus baoqingensis TaxID=2486013 RepID=A0ABW4E7U5_9LACO|nr:ABC transporter ATP-binding protein [Lacticaseibacillus baoqingensis]